MLRLLRFHSDSLVFVSARVGLIDTERGRFCLTLDVGVMSYNLLLLLYFTLLAFTENGTNTLFNLGLGKNADRTAELTPPKEKVTRTYVVSLYLFVCHFSYRINF